MKDDSKRRLGDRTGSGASLDRTGDTCPPAPTVDPQSEREIGERLRNLFSEVESQPVPDRMRKLLDELLRGKGDD